VRIETLRNERKVEEQHQLGVVMLSALVIATFRGVVYVVGGGIERLAETDR